MARIIKRPILLVVIALIAVMGIFEKGPGVSFSEFNRESRREMIGAKALSTFSWLRDAAWGVILGAGKATQGFGGDFGLKQPIRVSMPKTADLDTLTIPDTNEDLRDFIDDVDNRKAAFATPDLAYQFISKFSDNSAAHDKEMNEQRDEQMLAVFEKLMEDNGFVKDDKGKLNLTRLPMSEGGKSRKTDIYKHLELTRKQGRQILANGYGLGADMAGEFDNIGEWAKAVGQQDATWMGGRPVSDSRLKNLSEGVSGDGGELVPEEFRAELLMLALESAVVRPRARVVPMTGASVRFPAIRDTTHVSSVFGGVIGTWVPESGTVSSTTNQPTFAGVRLIANKLTGYTVSSNELLGDAEIGLESLIMSLFPQALAYFEDDAFMSGTGAGQPQGILNADALVTIAKETGQSATTIVLENILNMYSRMLPASLSSAVWVGHTDIFPQIATMALNVGTGGSAVWLANAVDGPPASILGRPLILTEKAETLGTAGDLYFVDFGQYLIGDRQAITMARSEHVNFTTDELAWRFVERVDGRAWLQSALTPRNGTNTVSPFVNLATRS